MGRIGSPISIRQRWMRLSHPCCDMTHKSNRHAKRTTRQRLACFSKSFVGATALSVKAVENRNRGSSVISARLWAETRSWSDNMANLANFRMGAGERLASTGKRMIKERDRFRRRSSLKCSSGQAYTGTPQCSWFQKPWNKTLPVREDQVGSFVLCGARARSQ